MNTLWTSCKFLIRNAPSRIHKWRVRRNGFHGFNFTKQSRILCCFSNQWNVSITIWLVMEIIMITYLQLSKTYTCPLKTCWGLKWRLSTEMILGRAGYVIGYLLAFLLFQFNGSKLSDLKKRNVLGCKWYI